MPESPSTIVFELKWLSQVMGTRMLRALVCGQTRMGNLLGRDQFVPTFGIRALFSVPTLACGECDATSDQCGTYSCGSWWFIVIADTIHIPFEQVTN